MVLMLAGTGEAGFYYFMTWLFFMCANRALSQKNERLGVAIHSRYAGDPWLARWVCKSDDFAKRYVEPLICFGVGVGLMPVSEILGAFVMSGMVSLGVVQAIEWQLTRVRVMQMRDAEIEQRYHADLYRGQRRF